MRIKPANPVYIDSLQAEQERRRMMDELSQSESSPDIPDMVPKEMATEKSPSTPYQAPAAQSAGAGVGNMLMSSGSAAMLAGATGPAAPIAIGAGAGLAVLAAKEERKRKQQELEYQDKQNRLEREQNAIGRLIGISTSLRNL